jgi:AraC family transcriptional regulator
MRRNASAGIEHNGQIIDSKLIAGLYLTETAYAPKINVPSHAHRHACFCLVLQGAYTETYRRKAIECRPFNLIFRPAGEVHSDSFGERSVRCFIIEVETEWLTRLRDHLLRMDVPTSFQSHSLAWLAMRVRNESRQADDFTPLAVEGLMLEMSAEMARRSVTISKRKNPPWLGKAKEILHENFNERMTLRSIAEAVGVHPVYLAGAFRQHYHCTIGEYVRRLRIEFAGRQMSETDAPLVDIALAAGFAHQAHFSRTFKRLTGLTPAEFRSAARPS